MNKLTRLDLAIDVIEMAKSYYILSTDSGSKPISVGNRGKLSAVLRGVGSDMVIVTTGDEDRCLVLMDYTQETIRIMVDRVNKARQVNRLHD